VDALAPGHHRGQIFASEFAEFARPADLSAVSRSAKVTIERISRRDLSIGAGMVAGWDDGGASQEFLGRAGSVRRHAERTPIALTDFPRDPGVLNFVGGICSTRSTPASPPPPPTGGSQAIDRSSMYTPECGMRIDGTWPSGTRRTTLARIHVLAAPHQTRRAGRLRQLTTGGYLAGPGNEERPVADHAGELAERHQGRNGVRRARISALHGLPNWLFQSRIRQLTDGL